MKRFLFTYYNFNLYVILGEAVLQRFSTFLFPLPAQWTLSSGNMDFFTNWEEANPFLLFLFLLGPKVLNICMKRQIEKRIIIMKKYNKKRT